MNKNDLLDRANILLNEEIDFNELKSIGINVDPWKHDFVHFYPPIGSLPPYDAHEKILMEEVDADLPIGLYFHIPFCSGLCIYCYYMKYEKSSEEIISKYLDAMEREVELISKHLKHRRIHSIAVGGGTPTYLSDKQLQRFFKIVFNNFDIPKGIEISVEANPETITFEKLQLLKELGTNRISIGVQSFEDEILSKIGRRHRVGEAISSIFNLQRAGMDNFNIDIMYRLPEQTFDHLFHTLEIVEGIRPPSVCFYQLWFSPDKPFGPRLPIHYLPKSYFLGIKEILLMKIIIREFMKSLGYTQDQICWFIRSEKYRCKQQVFRWKNNFYLGFGLSSYGYYNKYAYQNYEKDLKDYLTAIDRGELPIKIGKKLIKEEEARRGMVLGLKLTEGVDLNDFKKRYDEGSIELFKTTIDKLTHYGLIAIKNGFIKLTEKGKLFDDEVCRQFFEPRFI